MDETNQLHETIKGSETSGRSDSNHWKRLDWGSFWLHCSIDQFHRLLLTTSEETWGIFCNEAWRRVCQRTMTVLTAEKWLLVFRNHKHWGKRQHKTWHLSSLSGLATQANFIQIKGADIRNDTKGFLMTSCVQETSEILRRDANLRSRVGWFCLTDNFKNSTCMQEWNLEKNDFMRIFRC